MIIIAGTIDLADPAKRDEAIERAKPLQQATRDEEPGCHAYVFSVDPCVPGRIAVYELWKDETSLAAHFKHRNYFNMRDMLGSVGLAAPTTASTVAISPSRSTTPLARRGPTSSRHVDARLWRAGANFRVALMPDARLRDSAAMRGARQCGRRSRQSLDSDAFSTW